MCATLQPELLGAKTSRGGGKQEGVRRRGTSSSPSCSRLRRDGGGVRLFFPRPSSAAGAAGAATFGTVHGIVLLRLRDDGRRRGGAARGAADSSVSPSPRVVWRRRRARGRSAPERRLRARSLRRASPLRRPWPAAAASCAKAGPRRRSQRIGARASCCRPAAASSGGALPGARRRRPRRPRAPRSRTLIRLLATSVLLRLAAEARSATSARVGIASRCPNHEFGRDLQRLLAVRAGEPPQARGLRLLRRRRFRRDVGPRARPRPARRPWPPRHPSSATAARSPCGRLPSSA